jgi:hypothetical protein
MKQRMADAVVDAVERNDDRFFEHMTEIARFYKDRKSVADPLAAGIIGAICNVEREKELSSREITDYMNKVWPRADGVLWDDSEVRRGIRDMGLRGRTVKEF